MDDSKPRVLPLLLVASALTLVVTGLRFVGERAGWDPRWFSSEAGSPGNPFGIVWLVPVFGFAFGRRLAASGRPPFVSAFFVPMFGLVTVAGAAAYVFGHLEGEELRAALRWLFYGSAGASLLGLFAWPRAFFVHLAYGVLARAPVALLQYLDIQNGWQTHYGKVHPKLIGLDAEARQWTLAMAQAAGWVPFTILLGGACAALGAASVRKA